MTDYGHELTFGAFLTPQNQDPQAPVRLARLAETAGLDLVSFQDHPYQPAFLDTWTLLSWVAAQTERVTVAGNVLNLPLRPPAVLARAAASLDLLSGGRFALGLGAGAFWDAIEAMGGTRLSPGGSVTALAEAIEIIRGIWDPSERRGLRVDGVHHRVRGAKRGPAPAHDIPIWVGAYQPRMLRLVGRLADGWLSTLSYLKDGDLRRSNAVIDEAAERAGRHPAEVRRLLNIGPSQAPVAQWVEELAGLALTDGIGTFVLAADDPRLIQVFGEEVAPAVREAVARERAAAGAAPASARRGAAALALRRPGIDYPAVPASQAASACCRTRGVVRPVERHHAGGGDPAFRSGLVTHLDRDVSRAYEKVATSGVPDFLQIRATGGAAHDLAPDQTAYPHRHQNFLLTAVATGQSRLDAANLARLRRIKRAYDPDNVFAANFPSPPALE